MYSNGPRCTYLKRITHCRTIYWEYLCKKAWYRSVREPYIKEGLSLGDQISSCWSSRQVVWGNHLRPPGPPEDGVGPPYSRTQGAGDVAEASYMYSRRRSRRRSRSFLLKETEQEAPTQGEGSGDVEKTETSWRLSMRTQLPWTEQETEYVHSNPRRRSRRHRGTIRT